MKVTVIAFSLHIQRRQLSVEPTYKMFGCLCQKFSGSLNQPNYQAQASSQDHSIRETKHMHELSFLLQMNSLEFLIITKAADETSAIYPEDLSKTFTDAMVDYN